MKYLKNVEAASIYHVSEKSVRNWIDAAQSGKLELELHQENGKYYVANTTKNQTLMKELVERGKKYKNGRGLKVVSPLPEFYKIYGPEQIFDILSNLDIHREIPLQYTYFDSGAEHWDSYTKRLFTEHEANTLNATIRLLENSLKNLDDLTTTATSVNVIDLGIGNALPVRGLLTHLLSRHLLKRYIGIDISEEMLKIASRNIDKWFDGKLHFERYLKDINYHHFEHIIAEDAFNHDKQQTANIVLLLGGTLSNMQTPTRVLQLINDSMGRNDVLIHSLKLDSENSRRYFNLDAERQSQKLNPQFSQVVRLLGIPESSYDIEQSYSHEQRARFVCIVFKFDLTLEFSMGNAQRSISLSKGDKVTVWRARHRNALEVINEFDAAGFDLLSATKTPDQEYLLTISKVKTGTPDNKS